MTTNEPDFTGVDAEWKFRRKVEDRHSAFNLRPTLANADALTAAVAEWRANEATIAGSVAQKEAQATPAPLTRDALLAIITEDITNREDGAGSDLRYAHADDEGVWIELEGALDVSALTNTILAAVNA